MQFPGQQHEKTPKEAPDIISVFDNPAGQQLLTPAICNWILVARNCLHMA